MIGDTLYVFQRSFSRIGNPDFTEESIVMSDRDLLSKLLR